MKNGGADPAHPGLQRGARKEEPVTLGHHAGCDKAVHEGHEHVRSLIELGGLRSLA